MTNGTVNKALLSFAVFAAILVATGIISALIAQSAAAAENTSSTIKTTQSHICHYKAKDSPILHSCNDVVRGSVSHPGESK
jgi:hypothetical protein